MKTYMIHVHDMHIFEIAAEDGETEQEVLAFAKSEVTKLKPTWAVEILNDAPLPEGFSR